MLPIVPDGGSTTMDMRFQATNVTKALGSVKHICTDGHAVLFMDEEYGGSYIIDLASGNFEAMRMREEDGNYVLDTWVAPAEENGEGFVRQP